MDELKCELETEATHPEESRNDVMGARGTENQNKSRGKTYMQIATEIEKGKTKCQILRYFSNHF